MTMAMNDQLRALVLAYAKAADTVDGEAAAQCFLPDGVLEIYHRGQSEPVRSRHGRAAIAEAFAGLARYEVTMHYVMNSTFTSVNETQATGETYCQAHHIQKNESGQLEDYVMHIRYLDDYAHSDEGWKIRQRHLQVEFTETRVIDQP